jgi:hypothetical protein
MTIPKFLRIVSFIGFFVTCSIALAKGNAESFLYLVLAVVCIWGLTHDYEYGKKKGTL